MKVEIDLDVDGLNDHIKEIVNDELPDFDDIKEDQDLVSEDEVETIMENKLEELVKNEMDDQMENIRDDLDILDKGHVRDIIRNCDTISNLQRNIDMMLIRISKLEFKVDEMEKNNTKTAGNIWKELQEFVTANAEGGH